jgi:ABC-type phosphate/phosphonate transport system substrate-binding protein
MIRTAKQIFVFGVALLLTPQTCPSEESPVNNSTGNIKNHLNVGYVTNTTSGVNQRDAKIALEMLVRKIIKSKANPGFEAESMIFQNIEAAVQAINSNRIELLTMTTTDYISVRDKINADPAYVKSNNDGEVGSKFVLLCKKNKILGDSLNGLRDKTLVTVKGNNDFVSIMWMDTLLNRQRLPLSRTFFSTIKQVCKNSHPVLQVFFGKADACLVEKEVYEMMIELNPQIKKTMTVLAESPAFLLTITAIRRNADSFAKKNIAAFREKIAEDSEGKQIMMIFQSKKVLKFRPEYLLPIENLYSRYQEINNKK